MGIGTGRQHAHETTVVPTGLVLMTQDKPAGWLLGNATHGWRGIERFEHIAQHVGTGQTEMDVGTQMTQMGRRHRVGTLQTIVVGEGPDARLDIIGDVLLLLPVLLRPLRALYSLRG